MNTIYNRNAVVELYNRGYHIRHIAIVMGCVEDHVRIILKTKDTQEPTLKFLNFEQKQRLYVLDKLLTLKRTSPRWCSNDYYYITILKFLLVPREAIYKLYHGASLRQVSMAYKEKSPFLQLFDCSCFNITTAEYKNFMQMCYIIINDTSKWR